MSIVIATSVQGWGFLMSDTRVNVTANDGTIHRLDAGSRQIGLPDGGHLDIPDRFRKLSPLSTGWIAAVAITYPLVQWSFPRLNINNAQPKAVAGALREALADAQARFPNEELDRGSARYALIYEDNGVKLRVLWQDGSDAINPPLNYAIMAPPELDDRLNKQLQTQFLNTLKRVKLDSIDGLPAVVKEATKVVEVVSSNCDSVSNSVELGVLLPDGEQAYILGQCHTIGRLDDSTFLSSLEWLNQ